MQRNSKLLAKKIILIQYVATVDQSFKNTDFSMVFLFEHDALCQDVRIYKSFTSFVSSVSVYQLQILPNMDVVFLAL